MRCLCSRNTDLLTLQRASVTSKPLRGAPYCERGEDPVAATLLTSVRPCDVERADIKHRTTAEEGAYNNK